MWQSSLPAAFLVGASGLSQALHTDNPALYFGPNKGVDLRLAAYAPTKKAAGNDDWHIHVGLYYLLHSSNLSTC